MSLREHEGDMASPGDPDPLRPDIELARWVSEYWYTHINQIPCHLSGCIISCCKTGLLAFTGVSADYSTDDLYLFHGVFPLVVDICLGIEKLLLQ